MLKEHIGDILGALAAVSFLAMWGSLMYILISGRVPLMNRKPKALYRCPKHLERTKKPIFIRISDSNCDICKALKK